MIVGTVCLSHSPLRDGNRPPVDVEERFDGALAKAAEFVAQARPDLAIIFYPDHLNGFFYKLLPPFCIGIEATSVGDYGTAAGKLNVPANAATSLSRFVLGAGVDVAISHSMEVDHGAVQPMEWLMDGAPEVPVIPIFVNSGAEPLPPFSRAAALGQAVGDWARRADERILIVGSGGLSHDPPMASLASATSETKRRIVHGEPLLHAQRKARQSRAKAEGLAMARGESALRAINPEWDKRLLAAFCTGELDLLDHVPDSQITYDGGRGGHEVRAWVAALSALRPGYTAEILYYEQIDAWITGMGILTAIEPQPTEV